MVLLRVLSHFLLATMTGGLPLLAIKAAQHRPLVLQVLLARIVSHGHPRAQSVLAFSSLTSQNIHVLYHENREQRESAAARSLFRRHLKLVVTTSSVMSNLEHQQALHLRSPISIFCSIDE